MLLFESGWHQVSVRQIILDSKLSMARRFFKVFIVTLFWLNDQPDPNKNYFDGINLIKTNCFDIDGAIKQLKSLQEKLSEKLEMNFVLKI